MRDKEEFLNMTADEIIENQKEYFTIILNPQFFSDVSEWADFKVKIEETMRKSRKLSYYRDLYKFYETKYNQMVCEQMNASIPHFMQQINTNKGVKYVFNSSLYLEHFRSSHHYFIGDNGSQVYLYKNGYYKKTSAQEIRYICDQDVFDFSEDARTPRNSADFYELLLHTDTIINVSEDISADYINFKNGLLDFRTFKLIPHSPDILTVHQIPCNWDPSDISTPIFDKYLDDLTEGDEETKIFLMTWMGLIISNVSSRHFKKALMMVGESNSGKSKIKELTEAIIGEENCAQKDLKQLEERFATADVYDKRLCGVTDMKTLDIDDLPVFKQATGGDLINVEKKGEKSFAARFDCFFWFTCNKLPRIKRDDVATYNRLIILECNNVIPEEKRDSELVKKMVDKELPGILFRCLVLAQDVVKHNYKLPIPTKAQNRLRQYIVDNNPVSEFLKNYTEPLRPNQNRSDGIEVSRFARVFDEWNKRGRKVTPQQRNKAISEYFCIPENEVIYRSHGGRYYPFSMNEDGKELKYYGTDVTDY